MDELGQSILQQLRESILESVDTTRELNDDDIKEIIDREIIRQSHNNYIPLNIRQDLKKELFNSMRKLDILQELVDNPKISEVMINGPDDIFVELDGRLTRWNKKFSSREKLEDVIQQIAAKSNRMVNESSPISDTRLSDGSRVNIVLNPIAINGPSVTIRRFPEHPINIEKLISIGAITDEAANFLQMIMFAGYNIFISGGTGSGKTTFLNALSEYIPEDERVITIEDSAELQLLNVKNIVKLETRNSNTEGCNAISIRDLIKTALRMRPDRVLVGEIRGLEAIDMLQAMNTGHDGSLSTGHANSPSDMLSRIETMVLMGMDIPLEAVRRQIASGIDIIIHLGRLRDKSRKVLEIIEIEGFEDGNYILNSLYRFEEKTFDKSQDIDIKKVEGKLIKTGELKKVMKLNMSGIFK